MGFENMPYGGNDKNNAAEERTSMQKKLDAEREAENRKKGNKPSIYSYRDPSSGKKEYVLMDGDDEMELENPEE